MQNNNKKSLCGDLTLTKLYAELCDTVPGSCGLGVAFEFSYTTFVHPSWSSAKPIDKDFVHSGGTGFFVAMFVVGDETCDKAYEVLKAKYEIVYQSPVRKNVNSNNDVFFCVFDGGEGTHGFDKYEEFYNED